MIAFDGCRTQQTLRPSLLRGALVAVTCLGLLAACGGDTEVGFQGSGAGDDAAGGAPAGQGGTAPGSQALVHTIGAAAGEPLTGVVVLVSDASGELFQQHETDAKGKAQVEIPTGGMVTVAYEQSSHEDGEILIWRQLHSAVGLTDGGTYQVRLAAGSSRELSPCSGR